MFLSMPNSQAYKRSVNYDESKVPQYELPDPLVFNEGKVVKNHRQWTKKRRAEIIEIFSQEMYGHIPARPEGMHYRTLSEETVYGGLGLRKVVRIYLDTSDEHWFDILIHLPAKADGPVPMFVGLNFKKYISTPPITQAAAPMPIASPMPPKLNTQPKSAVRKLAAKPIARPASSDLKTPSRTRRK